MQDGEEGIVVLISRGFFFRLRSWDSRSIIEEKGSGAATGLASLMAAAVSVSVPFIGLVAPQAGIWARLNAVSGPVEETGRLIRE